MTTGVLIPVHGFAPYLAEALDCVLAEGPDAVVVVDDGSRDPLALHPDHARRVTLVRSEQRGGPAAARAIGLEALADDVDLIALCDADDAWEPGKLAAQVAALTAHPGAAVAFGRATVVGPDDRPTGERWAEPAAGLHDAAVFGRELYAANAIPTSSAVLRRAALQRAGGFAGPVAVAEDWELWLRIAATGGAFVCVPEARVRYRRHPGGLTAGVAALAEAQLAVHDAHAALVDPATRDRVLAADLVALAAGRAREGRHDEARAALAQAALLAPPGRRQRVRRAALAVPGVRALAGRRDPYRRNA